MLVAYNVPKKSVIDRGMPRRVGDSLFTRGLISRDLSGNDCIAIANAYLNIAVKGKPTDTMKAELLNKYEDQIFESIAICGKSQSPKITGRAGVQAAVFAALIKGIPASRLYRFCACVNSGFYDCTQGEDAAILLHKFLVNNRGHGAEAIKEICFVTQSAIKDFIEKNPRKKRYTRPKNIYIDDYDTDKNSKKD